MTIRRKFERISTPPAQPGFLGAGHIARPVIYGDFNDTDPFILLMDDMLDKKDEIPVGGPHPHAGFETVALVLEGEIGDGEEKMSKGDLQLMTAGSGVVHTETIDKKMKMRILQLWLSLPAKHRWAQPRLQDLKAADAPSVSVGGAHIKLYSGKLAGISSPIRNYTPMILADISMDNNATTSLELPARYNTMLYVLNGSVSVGEQTLGENQAGWLDLHSVAEQSELSLNAGATGARLILYSGQPTGDPIVSHGPFIGDTAADITRLYHEYRQGKMPHIHDVHAAEEIGER